MEESGSYLSEDEYKLVAKSTPLPAVDLLPWRRTDGGSYDVLLIRRLDRRGAGCWCWIGGRIMIDESIGEAAARHIVGSVGPDARFAELRPQSPARVIEYQRNPRLDGPYDPAKHSIGLTYPIEYLGGPLAAAEEALAVEWFPSTGLPAEREFSFGQARLVRSVAQSIEKYSDQRQAE